MAMINCPECGKEISDKAKTCIHCGCPIDEQIGKTEMTAPSVVTVVEDHKKSAQKKLLISTILSFVGSVVIEIFLSFCLFQFSKEPLPEADVTVTIESAELISSFAKWLISQSGLTLLFVFCLMPFVFSFLVYLMKKPIKKVFCAASVVASVALAVLFVCVFLTEPTYIYCLGIVIFAPPILFLVSAFLNVLGTREYFKDAE